MNKKSIKQKGILTELSIANQTYKDLQLVQSFITLKMGTDPPKILCNKLIANIMKGNTYCTSDVVMIETVTTVFSEQEILEARRLIFDFFPPEDDKGLDMGAKERRHTTKLHAEDVVNKVIEVSKKTNDVILCMPWNETFHEFISGEEKLANEVIKQKEGEIDERFAALEKQIDLKNKATIEAVKVMCDNLQKFGVGSQQGVGLNARRNSLARGGGGAGGLVQPAPALGQYASVVSGKAGFPAAPTGRERSDSTAKRRRLDDASDTPEQLGDAPATPGWEVKGRRGHRAQKAVVGNGGGSGHATGRKMKTARADIFIYAVDISTTVDDIVEDLASSNIEVHANHVVKKTRAGVEARFDCYRISVKQEDLDKSLKPETWPLGVRVRPWVHYPASRPSHGREGDQVGSAAGHAH